MAAQKKKNEALKYISSYEATGKAKEAMHRHHDEFRDNRREKLKQDGESLLAEKNLRGSRLGNVADEDVDRDGELVRQDLFKGGKSFAHVPSGLKGDDVAAAQAGTDDFERKHVRDWSR